MARADVPGRQVLGENALRLVDQRLPLRRIDFYLLSFGDPVEFRIAVVRGVEAAARAENGAQIEVGIEPLFRRTETHHRGHDVLAAVNLAEDLTERLRLVIDRNAELGKLAGIDARGLDRELVGVGFHQQRREWLGGLHVCLREAHAHLR